MIFFRFAQPLLISRAIRFVTDSSSERDDCGTGVWMIMAAATIYTGMAVSSQHTPAAEHDNHIDTLHSFCQEPTSTVSIGSRSWFAAL